MSCKNQRFMAEIKSYNVVWDPKCAQSQILDFFKGLKPCYQTKHKDNPVWSAQSNLSRFQSGTFR